MTECHVRRGLAATMADKANGGAAVVKEREAIERKRDWGGRLETQSSLDTTLAIKLVQLVDDRAAP